MCCDRACHSGSTKVPLLCSSVLAGEVPIVLLVLLLMMIAGAVGAACIAADAACSVRRVVLQHVFDTHTNTNAGVQPFAVLLPPSLWLLEPLAD